jgi:hypothetical protein
MEHTDQWPRWHDDLGISDLSNAINEIYFLRAIVADEADIIAAHLDYKTFPKTRRSVAEAQVERLRRIARGELYPAARERFNPDRALRGAGAEDCLTNDMWARARGLKRVERPGGDV